MSQKTDMSTQPYFENWQSPQFYRTYYRRFICIMLFLTLSTFAVIGVCIAKYYQLYVQAEIPYYVFTSEGELVKLSPSFNKPPSPNATGAQ